MSGGQTHPSHNIPGDLSMRKLAIKTVAVTATALMGAAGLVATSTSSASAQDSPVNVVSVKGKAVIGYKAQTVALKGTVTAPSTITSWYITAIDVYHGSKKVGSLSYPMSSSSGSRFSFVYKSGWGRGTITFRNAQIHAYTADGSYSYTDTNFSTSFHVKSASDGKLPGHNALHIGSHGSHKSFKAGLRYFSAQGWKPWKGHKVKIQVKKGSHWKTIKKLKLNKKGVAKWHRTSHKKAKYRLLAKSTSTIQGGKTGGIKI